MKKLVMFVVLLLVVLSLAGCGKPEEKRNYFWTNLETGEQIHNLTQTEFDLLMNYWESPRLRYDTYRECLPIDWSQTTVEWVDVG